MASLITLEIFKTPQKNFQVLPFCGRLNFKAGHLRGTSLEEPSWNSEAHRLGLNGSVLGVNPSSPFLPELEPLLQLLLVQLHLVQNNPDLFLKNQLSLVGKFLQSCFFLTGPVYRPNPKKIGTEEKISETTFSEISNVRKDL